MCWTQGGNWRRDPQVSRSIGWKIVYGGICFFLKNAKNTFNEINQVGMIWTVWHLWPSGARFFFNWYLHWLLIVLRNENGLAGTLHSREGMTQGDPLEMITYRIWILPLINNLKWEIHDITQLWYADDAGALGTFKILETYSDLLTRQGSGRGYHPNPTKTVLLVRPENIKAVKVFGACHGFRGCRGARYLGG